MAIRVAVNGAKGRMGQQTVAALETAHDLSCVATGTRGDDMVSACERAKAQVVVDFTLPDCVFDNAMRYIEAGLHPVIGASGLTPTQIQQLQDAALSRQLGGVIAPNFSIAVVLMTQFAERAARYYPDAEIIEMHHAQKRDAPSGTAIKTAHMIARGREAASTIANRAHGDEGTAQTDSAAHGERVAGVAIHSVRLPGAVAHQQVIFGATGELFTLQHDTLTREAFMPGVLLACRNVVKTQQLHYGLEHWLV